MASPQAAPDREGDEAAMKAVNAVYKKLLADVRQKADKALVTTNVVRASGGLSRKEASS